MDQSSVLQKQQYQSTPDFLSGAQKSQSSLADQQKQEEDAYLSSQSKSANDFGLSSDVLSKAATDPGANSAIGSRLSSTQAAPVDAWSENVKLTNPAVDALNTPGQLAQYLQSRGGSNYTRGMAGLDQMLLQQDPAYKQAQINTAQQQQKLLNQQAADAANMQSQAQTARQANYDQATKSIQQNIGGQEQGILDALDKAAQTENDIRNPLRSNPDQDYLRQNTQDILKTLSGQNPALAPYLANASSLFDPSQYYGVGGQVGRSDVASKDQADQYARLLGIYNPTGANLITPGSLADNHGQSFDKTRYQQDVTGKAQAALDQATAQQTAATAAATQAARDQETAKEIDKQNKSPGQLADPSSPGMEAPGGWDTGPYFHDPSPNSAFSDINTALAKINTKIPAPKLSLPSTSFKRPKL